MPETIAAIQSLVEEIAGFWSDCHGWAPKEAAILLAKVRLDSFASLARSLNLTILTPVALKEDLPGRLILGWANLGSLLECALQIHLLVWLHDYQMNPVANRRKPMAPKLPHELELEELRVFFSKYVWNTGDKKRWGPWILELQQRRNAIHALKPRTLGTWSELEAFTKSLFEFLQFIDGHLPYPD